MAEEVRKNDIVTYRKEITTDEPNAYAEVVLKFEGLQESRLAELRDLFNKFFAEVEGMVLEDTSIAADPEKENQPQGNKVMRYKDGRPYFKEK